MLNLSKGNILVLGETEDVGDYVDGDRAEDNTPASGENDDDTASNCDGEYITIADRCDSDHRQIESAKEGTNLSITFSIQECLNLKKKEPNSNDEYRAEEHNCDC